MEIVAKCLKCGEELNMFVNEYEDGVVYLGIEPCSHLKPAKIYDGTVVNKLFVIRVTPLVKYHERSEYDREVDGDYLIDADSKEAALDFFHHNFPIHVLEDFDISVVE